MNWHLFNLQWEASTFVTFTLGVCDLELGDNLAVAKCQNQTLDVSTPLYCEWGEVLTSETGLLGRHTSSLKRWMRIQTDHYFTSSEKCIFIHTFISTKKHIIESSTSCAYSNRSHVSNMLKWYGSAEARVALKEKRLTSWPGIFKNHLISMYHFEFPSDLRIVLVWLSYGLSHLH